MEKQHQVLENGEWIPVFLVARTGETLIFADETGENEYRRRESTEGRTWRELESEPEAVLTERPYHPHECWRCRGYRQEGYAPDPADLRREGIVFGKCVADPDRPLKLKGVDTSRCLDHAALGDRKDPHRPWAQPHDSAWGSAGSSNPIRDY